MLENKVDNSNFDSGVLSQLSPQQAEKLSTVLDEYLTALERGNAPSLDELLSQHADIRQPLELYLGKLGELHHIAAGFAPQLSDIGLEASDSHSLALVTQSDSFQLTSPVPVGAAQEHAGSTHRPTLLDATRPLQANATSHGLSTREPESSAHDSQGVSTRVLQGDLPEEERPEVRRLDDFQLIRVIGRGGMGIVYEAQQISLKRQVALKLLPLISVLDARQITRFKNEAQAAASLQHPNIVPVYAVGNHRGVHYYAMRFIDGYALDTIIAALCAQRERPGSPLSPAQLQAIAQGEWVQPIAYQRVVKLGIQAALALAAAHEEGIVHRDIKPSNLMVDKQHKLWITDFGLARRLTDHSMTATGDVVGTLRYMSPEQARGQAALVDGRTDVYALGATLYELLALQPAISGDNSPEMLRAIDALAPTSLRQLRPDLPRDLVTVIEKAMAKVREDRYLTAQALADDLTCVLEGRPTTAKPATWMVRLTKWVQRNQSAARMAASIAMVALIFLSAGLWVVWSSRLDLANWQRQAAEQALALESYKQQVLLFEKEAAHIPRTDRLRTQMIQHLLSEYQKFVDRQRQRSNATPELSAALIDMGELNRKLNQHETAEALLAEAQQLARQLAIQHPQDPLPRRQMAKAIEQLAQIAYGQNQLPRAEELFEQAVQLQRELIEKFPENTTLLIELAQYGNNLALLQIKIGQNVLAQRILSDLRFRIEQVLEKSDASAAERQQLQQLLAAAYTNLAHLVRASNLQQAIDYYQNALKLNSEVARQANRTEVDLDLSGNYNNLGTALSEAGQLRSAAQQYAAAIKISRLLVGVDPEKELFTTELATGLNNLAMAELKLFQQEKNASSTDTSQLHSAHQHLSEAIGLQEKLVQQQPEHARLRHELGGMYHNLASAHEAAGLMDNVEPAYLLAIEHQRLAVENSPENVGYRNYLDTHLLMYWKWLISQRAYAQALETIDQQRRLWPVGDRKQLEIARHLAQSILDIPQTDQRPGNLAPLSAKLRECLSLAQEAGLSVQSMLSEEPFLSLIKLKWLTL